MPETIRVAIIGGGLMGCTLANGLLQFAHIDWQIFEAKSTFVERGAAVGFRDNGTKALAAMGIDHEGLYKRCGAVVSDGSHAMVAYGEHKGKTVSKLPAGHINFMRTRWLEELLALLPKERCLTNKKLASVEEPTPAQELYTLHFEDGSTHSAHVVIGCDGIHSNIRKLVLQDHSELIAPCFGGYWDARGSTTPQEAAKRFGNDLFDPTQSAEIALIGQGAFMLFCPMENGSEYMVIISALARPDFDATSWKTAPDREFLENAFQNWDQSFRDAVIDCITASGPGVVFSQWMTPETPTYICGPGLCIAGDAAHAVLPFLGNGAAMALEDAAVLSRLFGSCDDPKDVSPALQAFEWAQRNRSEDLVKLSGLAAKLMTGQLGLDPNEFASYNPDKWWTDIIDTDVEKIVQDAVQHFKHIRSST